MLTFVLADETSQGMVCSNKKGVSQLVFLFGTTISTNRQGMTSVLSPSDWNRATSAPLPGLSPVPGIALYNTPTTPNKLRSVVSYPVML
ncbi:hypothetical protein J6590_081770 [Homalodisca vitripennis]|nr:hypothetical protein J6590_081770 [Homalodisca vitripennis]